MCINQVCGREWCGEEREVVWRGEVRSCGEESDVGRGEERRGMWCGEVK